MMLIERGGEIVYLLSVLSMSPSKIESPIQTLFPSKV